MNKTPCKIIEDLLPLYLDGVCSEESNTVVEAHLKECEACRCAFEALNEDVVVKQPQGKPELKTIGGKIKSMQKKSLMKGIAFGLCACLLLVVGYLGLCAWHVVPVSAKAMEVSDMCILSDGNLAFHLYIDDSYDLHTVTVSENEDGTMYITPKRAVIADKRNEEYNFGLYNMDYIVAIETVETELPVDFGSGNVEIKKVVLGTENDGTVIWQEGDDVPVASEELEERYTDPN